MSKFIQEHYNKKNILNNDIFDIVLYNDLEIDEKIHYNLLYVKVKNNFMTTICDFEVIKLLNKDFLKSLENIYCAFDKTNNKLGIVYDLSEVTSIFPPTILWSIGKFFSSKKDITNKILYCTGVITKSPSINNLIQTFINIYDNVKPFKLCLSEEEVFNFVETQVKKYTALMANDEL